MITTKTRCTGSAVALPVAQRPHVWRIDLDDPALHHRRYLSWLDDEDHARHSRFRRDRDAARFLAARVAMRDVLGKVLGRKPKALAFVRNPFGKPMLCDAALAFNLSHSDSTALLAVTTAPTIGVDIERAEIPDKAAVLDLIVGPAERRRLSMLSDGVQHFRWLWTAKEAVLKACGRGLHLPLQDVAIPLPAPQSTGVALSRADGRLTLWRVHNLGASNIDGAALVLPLGTQASKPAVSDYN